jgi:chaperone modulatory protein CbpM
MMRIEEVVAAVGRVSREELTVWVESGWVRPRREGEGLRFDEVDVARVRLVRELRQDMELDDEALLLVLSLLDRMHGLRGQLRRLADALSRQPEDVRRAVFGACGFSTDAEDEPPR